jgi:hypothetical protein
MLLYFGLLVAHVNGRLHGQRLAELALSCSGGSTVASERMLDRSKAVAMQHKMAQHTMQGGLRERNCVNCGEYF